MHLQKGKGFYHVEGKSMWKISLNILTCHRNIKAESTTVGQITKLGKWF